MIHYLQGSAEQITNNKLVLQVSGVGFEIYLGKNNLADITIGQTYQIYINLQFRNEVFALYGFLKQPELEFFKILIKVSGVGPQIALNLISSIGTGAIYNAIKEKKIVTLTTISGIGKKTAERIIIDLNYKLEELSCLVEKLPGSGSVVQKETAELEAEIISALTNMGFSRKQIERVWDDAFLKNKGLADNLTRFLRVINLK